MHHAAWDKIFEVNLKGYFLATREVVAHLRSRSARGSIINVASVAGIRAAPMQGVYGMSKAAIISMTQTLAQECGPDGIRINALAPGLVETKFAAVLAALRQDPVLARLKLVAEPWDVATWATGRFPPGFAEWNDRFRDQARSYWLTCAGSRGDLAHALTASSTLFRQPGRQPQASVNFVTAHDGFTLADLVSYAHKHNEANLQHNADGNNDNRSINCGWVGVGRHG